MAFFSGFGAPRTQLHGPGESTRRKIIRMMATGYRLSLHDKSGDFVPASERYRLAEIANNTH